MKAILLRVGIDSNYGALSPVWVDYSYKYIPIYSKDIKEIEKNEKRTYKSIGLEKHLPNKYKDKKIHLDPEFKSFTYGEPGTVKRKALLTLKKNDLLVFYLGGQIQNDMKEIGCFIFAYFIVDKVLDWNNLSEMDKKKISIECRNNAHLRSSKSKDNLVIVKGNLKSKILEKCIPITEENIKSKNPVYVTSKEIKDFIGIRDHITRAVPIVIEEKNYIDNLKILLGIDKFDAEEYEGKVPFCLFSRIVDEDNTLTEDEKLFLKNFMISKGHNYKEAADNFGLDVYIDGNYRHTDLMEEYFIEYFYKL